MSKRNIIIIVIFAVLFISVYQSRYFLISKAPERTRPFFTQLVDGIINNTINELNFTREFKAENLSDDDYIDLTLSGDDLNHISNSMKLFIDEGYIRDELNPWRKAKVIVNNKNEKIKYKFHGTSVYPLKNGIRYRLGRIMEGLGLTDSVKVLPINSGVFSLKIKHKKEGNYFNQMRRYRLISLRDDAEISTIVVNRIASKLGLIAPHARMVILRINGSEAGSYMMEEDHSKEWLERDHQLTNYTIIKNNDDWDTGNKNLHSSGTDLYVGDTETKTISQESSPYALGAFDLLMKSVRASDMNQIKRLVDLDYMAKYLALLAITNSSQGIVGDNTRYIYDHTTGRFKVIFREENYILENNQTIENFNQSLFISNLPREVETFKLFKLLLTDSNFLTKRNEELYKIIKNNQEWESMAAEIHSHNFKVLMASNDPIGPIKDKIRKFEKKFANNLEKADQYLNYNKIFITRYMDIDGKQSFHILNDFTHPVILKNTSKSNNSFKTRNVLIYPSKIDINQNIVYKEQKINSNNIDISQATFENMITGKAILPRHIYFNNAIARPVFSERKSLETLKKNYIDYQVDNKNKVIIIKSGRYQINSNVIFPYGFNVIIRAGTKLFFNKGISLLVRGSLNIDGTSNQPVIVNRSQNKHPFGVFAVAGESIKDTKINIKYLKFGGGSEAIINSSIFTGQMSITNANVVIENSTFENSVSDDGINIKYSEVNISDSRFVNNFGDQIDLDYCQGIIINNIFSSKENSKGMSTDGLDISGSKVEVNGNTFLNLNDKAISVGEKSRIISSNNSFRHNNIAIAIKDESKAFVNKNQFDNNDIDISMYVKKKMYSKPSLYSIPSNKSLNLKIDEGDIFYLKNLQNSFEGVE